MAEIQSTSPSCPLGKAECPIIEEVNQLKQQVEALNNEVRTDHLTGLFNRRHLMFVLEQEIERTLRTQHPTSLLMLDIDHFKQFNDAHGHLVGDRVLIHLASILQITLRKLDIPCRYGGEEFAILLPSTPLYMGVQVAERVRQKLERTPIIHNDKELSITTSIGVDAFVVSSNNTPQDLLYRTDKQLYRAKQEGRNRICSAHSDSDSQSSVSADERNALFSNY